MRVVQDWTIKQITRILNIKQENNKTVIYCNGKDPSTHAEFPLNFKFEDLLNSPGKTKLQRNMKDFCLKNWLMVSDKVSNALPLKMKQDEMSRVLYLDFPKEVSMKEGTFHCKWIMDPETSSVGYFDNVIEKKIDNLIQERKDNIQKQIQNNNNNNNNNNKSSNIDNDINMSFNNNDNIQERENDEKCANISESGNNIQSVNDESNNIDNDIDMSGGNKDGNIQEQIENDNNKKKSSNMSEGGKKDGNIQQQVQTDNKSSKILEDGGNNNNKKCPNDNNKKSPNMSAHGNNDVNMSERGRDNDDN